MTTQIVSLSGLFLVFTSWLCAPSWNDDQAEAFLLAGSNLHAMAHPHCGHETHAHSVPADGTQPATCAPEQLQQAQAEYADLKSSLEHAQRYQGVANWVFGLGWCLMICWPIGKVCQRL